MARGRFILLLAGLLLVPVAGAWCYFGRAPKQDGPAPETPADGHYVTHALPPVFLDVDPQIKHRFEVVNDTAGPVRFARVQPSCSCSSAELGAKELAPGEKTVLDIAADLRGDLGPRRLHCRLITDNEGPWLYELTTTVYTRVEFSGGTQVALGSFNPGERVTRELGVHLHSPPGTEAARLLAVRSPDDQVGVAVGDGEDSTLPDGVVRRRVPLTLTLLPQSLPGKHEVLLRATGKHGDTEFQASLPLYWHVKSLYEVGPQRVFFGKVGQEAGPVSKKVLVRRSDGKPFSVRNLTASHPAVGVTAGEPSAPRAEHELTVTLDPIRVQSHLWAQVRLETDYALQPTLEVPVAAVR